jgi:hypothetical protein
MPNSLEKVVMFAVSGNAEGRATTFFVLYFDPRQGGEVHLVVG